ncbi:MAG: hypothetical protein HY716_16820 [Planctomycetes bacterium]|nr:hypothetical protein [Planctomycetota bacterium]
MMKILSSVSPMDQQDASSGRVPTVLPEAVNDAYEIRKAAVVGVLLAVVFSSLIWALVLAAR